jgi:putative membrane protein
VREKLLLAVKGFCMGAADVVPGVSGGTMAFILGIYTELIAAIKSFDSAWLYAIMRLDIKTAVSKPHFAFLIPLGAGLFCALLFFTRIVHLPVLLLDYPEQIYGLFFGLIVGSIIVLANDMKGLKTRDYLMVLPGVVIGLIVFNLVPTQTPETSWFVFLSGALAICAMILPGISGSFILLILNKYAYVFNAIGYFKFSILIPFGLGAITGLLIFSRLLSSLLSKYYEKTILFIAGLLIASLYVIWPFQERVYTLVREKQRLIASTPIIPVEISEAVIVSVALLIGGLLFVITIHRFSAKNSLRR